MIKYTYWLYRYLFFHNNSTLFNIIKLTRANVIVYTRDNPLAVYIKKYYGILKLNQNKYRIVFTVIKRRDRYLYALHNYKWFAEQYQKLIIFELVVILHSYFMMSSNNSALTTNYKIIHKNNHCFLFVFQSIYYYERVPDCCAY